MTNSIQPRPPTYRWSPALVAGLRGAAEPQTAAVLLATAGVPVFPCVPLGKHPLTKHGFQDASVDPDQVGQWWQRWPDANVAMPTGAVSGIDVVDIDVHSSGTGYAALHSARSSGLLGQPAWLVKTPSSGLHLCFLRAETDRQPSWQVSRCHVDFRGDGGYVLLPPSRVAQKDGTVGQYEVIDIATQQPGSVDAGALRRFLEPPRPMRPPSGLPSIGARPDHLAAWVASRPAGGRNQGLFWASCRMAEAGERFDVTAAILSEAALSSGLSEREAMITIQSAYRTATGLGTDSRQSEGPHRRQATNEVRL